MLMGVPGLAKRAVASAPWYPTSNQFEDGRLSIVDYQTGHLDRTIAATLPTGTNVQNVHEVLIHGGKMNTDDIMAVSALNSDQDNLQWIDLSRATFVDDLMPPQVHNGLAAFDFMDNLENLYLPEQGSYGLGVTTPGTSSSMNGFLFGNQKMTSFTIPDNVTSLGNCAVYLCSELKQLVVGAGVRTIGLNGITYDRKLASVTFRSKTPPQMAAPAALVADHGIVYSPNGSTLAETKELLKVYMDWAKVNFPGWTVKPTNPTLSGQVVDKATGQPIVGAKLTLSQQPIEVSDYGGPYADPVTFKSDSQGGFVFNNVNPLIRYNLVVLANGYKVYAKPISFKDGKTDFSDNVYTIELTKEAPTPPPIPQTGDSVGGSLATTAGGAALIALFALAVAGILARRRRRRDTEGRPNDGAKRERS
jgi:hypothetical protein